MLQNYFKRISEEIRNDWNVEVYLNQFGTGKSNEGTDEGKAIKRYYVEPHDERFRQIFLNFDENRNIESIVWFFNKDSRMKLGQLKHLFGKFNSHNLIYDETTYLVFLQDIGNNLQHVSTTIMQWLEKRANGSLYYKKAGHEIDITDDYEVSNVTIGIKGK